MILMCKDGELFDEKVMNNRKIPVIRKLFGCLAYTHTRTLDLFIQFVFKVDRIEVFKRSIMTDNNKRKDVPKIYLQIRPNYLSTLGFCDRAKRIEMQRLFTWLSCKLKRPLNLRQSTNRLFKKPNFDAKIQSLGLKYEHLKNLNKFNFDKELKGYIYGYPPKKALDQMQVELRTYTGK